MDSEIGQSDPQPAADSDSTTAADKQEGHDHGDHPVPLTLEAEPNLVPTAVQDEQNLVSTAVQDEPNLVPTAVQDEPNLVPTAVQNEPNLVPTAVQDEPNPVPTAVQDDPNLVPTAVQNEPNLVPTAVQDEPNLVSTAIQDEPNLVPTAVQNEPNQVSTAIQDEPNLVPTAVQNEPNLVPTAVQDEVQDCPEEPITGVLTPPDEEVDKEDEHTNEVAELLSSAVLEVCNMEPKGDDGDELEPVLIVDQDITKKRAPSRALYTPPRGRARPVPLMQQQLNAHGSKPKPAAGSLVVLNSRLKQNMDEKKTPKRDARRVTSLFTRKDMTEIDFHLSKAQEIGPIPIAFEFDDMNLKPELRRGIADHGYEKPSVCQQHMVLTIASGRDVMCQAQSGMGKTATFCISVLQRLDFNDPFLKALVLAPTRELAQQIEKEFNIFGQYMGVKIVPCYRSAPDFPENLKKVALDDYHIAVGTVGTVGKLFWTKDMKGELIKILVLDEADKLVMDPSFRWEMQMIISSISARAQVIATSATLGSAAYDRCRDIMRRPFELLIPREGLTLDGIKQFHVRAGNDAGKLETFNELLPFLQSVRGITFCNTRERAEKVTQLMRDRGHSIEGLVGTMEPDVRKKKLGDFMSGGVPTLIASDLIGRGIDDENVQLVINYDIPVMDYVFGSNMEQYIHRIGRAGRFGNKGIAITLINDDELEKLKRLEEYYHTVIPQLTSGIEELMNYLK